MRYRRTLLLAEESITAAGTKTIDIRVKEPISRITMAWRVTKSKDNLDDHPCNDITKIELIDGSDVLHSLNGAENQALAIYSRKVPTMNHGQQTAANSNYSTYGIDFGRRLFDPMLAFDPKRFLNPQLKISHNLAVADTAASQAYLEIWADLFDEFAPSPIGFLSAKEHKSYTCGAAASYEYTELPVDRTLRRLLLRGWYKGYEPWYQLIEARLDEDNDKRVLFDMDLEDYHRMQKGERPFVMEQLVAYVDSAATFYVTPTDYYCIPLGLGLGSYLNPSTYARGGYVQIGSASGTNMALMLAAGWLPNHCFDIPFGNPDDIEDWYDLANVGSLRLRLKAGGAGASGVGQIVTEQLRRY